MLALLYVILVIFTSLLFPLIIGENGDKTAAMYGGVREHMVEELVQRTRLGREQVFLDIGSGIGQVGREEVEKR
jgi:hypothetical protein